MDLCPSCGKETVAGHSFCGHCGAALDVAPAADTQAEVTTPEDQPQPAPALVNPFAGFDIWAVLRGNWVAAAITAGTALGVALLSVGALVLISDPEGVGFDDEPALITAGAAASVSANVVMDFDYDLSFGFTDDEPLEDEEAGEDFSVDSSSTAGAVPLLISILSLGAAALVFRRQTRGYRSFGQAVGDAGRAGLLYGFALFLLALFFRGSGAGDTDEGLWPAMGGSAHLDYGASRAGSLFLGILVLFAVLFVASFMRRDWLGPRATKVHDATAAPIAG